ncbi:MAG: hypothetical protein ACD_16C00091G0003 [uncultured bacterium]|nr:MAG: hypothetical protein ACD_16C00091G0003 [uncultured bacterium]
MATSKEVAEFMYSKIDKINTPQQYIAGEIEKAFGGEFITFSGSGNRIIDKGVLREFRKLAAGNIQWDNGAKAWRRT